MPKYLKEAGALPILILLAAFGLIVFIIFSSIIPFTNNLLRLLYPKPSSFAKQEISPSAPDEILIKFKPGVNENAKNSARKAHGLEKLDEITQIGVEKLRVPANAKDKVMEALSKNPNVEYVELNYIGEVMTIPNDLKYPEQYALPKISAPAAWDKNTGSPSVVIAVIDTGFNKNHEDLIGKAVNGFNTKDNNPDFTDVGSYHGTAVAGVAAALSNNGKGIAGVSWNSPIMPIKVAFPDGRIDYYATVDAIGYAADKGAKVINLSMSFWYDVNKPPRAIQDAITLAWNKGVILVAAMGNTESTIPRYPANLSNVMAVGATNNTDTRWTETFPIGSDTGEYISVVAPGQNIYSLNNQGNYSYWTGTSIATPHVAGLAALLFSANPSLTNQQVVNIITSTADDLGPVGWDSEYGCGRINALRALQMANNPPAVPSCAPASTPLPTSGQATPTPSSADKTAPIVSITSPLNNSTVKGTITIAVFATDNIGVTNTQYLIDGVTKGSDQTAPYTFSWNTTNYTKGTHTITARAKDAAGNIGTSTPISVTVSN